MALVAVKTMRFLIIRKLLEQWWVLNKYFEEIFAKCARRSTLFLCPAKLDYTCYINTKLSVLKIKTHQILQQNKDQRKIILIIKRINCREESSKESDRYGAAKSF